MPNRYRCGSRAWRSDPSGSTMTSPPLEQYVEYACSLGS
jgi:hypothetical protein